MAGKPLARFRLLKELTAETVHPCSFNSWLLSIQGFESSMHTGGGGSSPGGTFEGRGSPVSLLGPLPALNIGGCFQGLSTLPQLAQGVAHTRTPCRRGHCGEKQSACSFASVPVRTPALRRSGESAWIVKH